MGTQWPRTMGKEDIVWNPRTNKFEKASDKLQSGDALHQMIAAAKEREKNEETAKWACFYFCCIFVSSIFNISACATSAWYTYKTSDTLQTVQMEDVIRTQEWTFGLYGLSALVKYCDALTGVCVTDVDQFRYFDNSKNPAGSAWKAEYVAPAATAGEAGADLRGVMIASVVFAFVCFGSMLASMMNNHVNQARCTTCMIITATCTGMMNFFMLNSYGDGTKGIRDLLQKKSFIAGVTGPKFEVDFSQYLAWTGSVIGALAIFPTIRIVQYFHEPEDAAQALAKARDKRIKQYLNDHQNSSHDLERFPEDSQGFRQMGGVSQASQKYQGWTLEVETMPVNTFAIDPSKSIGGFRIREVEEEVPNDCCFGLCVCGTRKEMVKKPADTIKPNAVVLERRKEEAERLERKKKEAEKAGIIGVGLPSAPREGPDEEKVYEVKMRPLQPKSPMGGTFSAGFNRSPSVPATSGAPFSAGAPDIRYGGGGAGGFTGMTATPMSSAAADYMAGFKPGPKGTLPTSPFVGNDRLGAMAKMGGDVKVKLAGKFEDGTDASVGLKLKFSETGQPLAQRVRTVTRAPKQDKRYIPKQIEL